MPYIKGHDQPLEFVEDDGWDWPWLLYMGRVWLHIPEEEFWEYTPRKFVSLLEVHLEILEMKRGKKTDATTWGTIDQIPGW